MALICPGGPSMHRTDLWIREFLQDTVVLVQFTKLLYLTISRLFHYSFSIPKFPSKASIRQAALYEISKTTYTT